MVRPVVIVKDLTESTLTDLWDGCKWEEGSWDNIYGRALYIVTAILRSEPWNRSPQKSFNPVHTSVQGQVRVAQRLALKKSVLFMERPHSMGAY